jgi:mRNA interferase HigB
LVVYFVYLFSMRIIARRTLRDFWKKHNDAELPLKVWYEQARKAEWNNFQDIKKQFGSASIVGHDRVVFNIKGNDYRLVVLILFRRGKAFIRFVGTHKEYDKIDAKNI